MQIWRRGIRLLPRLICVSRPVSVHLLPIPHSLFAPKALLNSRAARVVACTSGIGIQRLKSDGLPAFARICVNRLLQTTEARIGRVLKKIFLLRCFSFSKKEKSICFNRRERAGGVARGRRDGTRVLFLCLATEKDTKKNALEGLR